MSSNGHVTLSDFSDREILLMILDMGGEVTTNELAVRVYGWGAIESEDEGKVRKGRHCVGSRLSWMRRFGLIESWIEVEDGQPKSGTRTWKPSIPGKSMVERGLPNAVEAVFSRASDNYDLEIANRIGEKLFKAGEITGTAMRRELQFHIERRRRR